MPELVAIALLCQQGTPSRGRLDGPGAGRSVRPGDCDDAAARASEAFSGDLRFSHFWEEEGWPVSTALRPLLGFGDYEPTRSAWDVDLFYEPGVKWMHRVPPTPTA